MTDKEKEKRKYKRRVKRDMFLKYLFYYFLFFVACSIIITTSIISFGVALNLTIDLNEVAHGTFLTVCIILTFSFLVLLVYMLLQHLSVNLPVRKIRNQLHKIGEGNFNEKLERFSPLWGVSQFNPIVDDINITVDELKNMSSLREDFVNNVSHELKTPLSVIQNYSQLLQEDNLSEEDRINYARIIASTSEEMNMLVKNALKLNNIEHQNIFPDHKKFSLVEQLSVCILAFEEAIELKHLSINANFDEDIIVDTDEELLSHVWLNLLSNAIKFSKENGCITVKIKNIDDVVTVAISDDGCGISDDEKPYIFDKYYRGNTANQIKGNGLGLPLVKRIVDVLGMRISFDSELDKGSIFVVSMNV